MNAPCHPLAPPPAECQSAPRFLGLEFAPLRLEHRAELSALLARHPQPLSGYTFASLAAWNDSFRYAWARPRPDTLLVACDLPPDTNRHLLQPVGPVDGELQRHLTREAARLGYALRVAGVSEPFLAAHPELAASFEVVEDQAMANYVYAASDLAELPGKRYQPKRNLIAQAQRAYAWTVEPLAPGNLADCAAFIREFRKSEGLELAGSLLWEARAFDFSLEHFAELGQEGILLRVDGHPAAVSIFERQSPDTAVIHFERALRRYKGLSQVVNHEAARLLRDRGYAFINREEDLGNEGLRKAKLSYHPVRIERAFGLKAVRLAG